MPEWRRERSCSWRSVRCGGAALLLASTVSGYGHEAVTADQGVGERPYKKEYTCPSSICTDPLLGDDICYEPVCPPGFFKCCATCEEAPCFGSVKMELSWRGLRECILCPSGHYCDGCDTVTRCVPSDKPGREGPRIAPEGSTQPSYCETCGTGYEADLDAKYCIPAYTKVNGVAVCNKFFLKKCILGCSPPDKTRRIMTECEKMECTMYCAKKWSNECAQRLGSFCRESTVKSNYTGGLAISDEVSSFIDNCHINCNGSSQTAAFSSLTLALMMSVILQAWA